MLIYNHEKELIGIDAKDLESLGFQSLAQLLAETSDFADMFVKKAGFIHNFQHVHWIDFVKTASDVKTISEVIIKAKNKQYQAELVIDSIFLNDEPSLPAFIVHLKDLRILGEDIKVEKKEKDTTIVKPTIHIEEELNEKEEKQEEEFFEDNYFYDPIMASQELNLPVDLVEEFILDFIKQANEAKVKIYNALKDDNIEEVKVLVQKLKGVSANLRVDNIFKLLTSIEDIQDKNKIEKILDRIYSIIKNLYFKKDENDYIQNDIDSINIYELSDDIFLDKTDIEIDNEDIDKSLEVMYDKEDVAKQLGISYKNFEELFNDFLIESKTISEAIHDAILEDNPDSWTIEAIKLKGISGNMHLYECVDELDNIILTKDKTVAQNSINKIDYAIKSLSKI